MLRRPAPPPTSRPFKGFGGPAAALAGAAAAVLLWSATALRRRGVVAAAGLVGAAAAWAAVRIATDAYCEAALFRGATAFLLTVIGVCATVGRGARTRSAPVRKRADSPP